MTKIVGLTGGIGSGKSSVTALLTEFAIPIIDTDILARQLVEPGSAALQEITDLFGANFIQKDGQLNRALLRKHVFNDAEKKQQLENILHPKIQAATQEKITFYQQQNPKLIVIAIPLLVEGIIKNGEKPHYIDIIWVVDCSEQQQLERASQRDNNNPALIQKIIDQQVKRNTRLEYADQIIDNSGDAISLRQQVKKLVSS